VQEDVLGFEVTVYDIQLMEFLDKERLTATPLMICLTISMASFSGMILFSSM